MPNNYLSVLYKHIIQVENNNVGLKVCVCVGGGHKHTIAPPPNQKWGGTCLYACFLVKISNFIICFCSFYLSCPIFETIILLRFEYYICLVFLNLVCFNLVKNASRFMCFSSPDNVTV